MKRILVLFLLCFIGSVSYSQTWIDCIVYHANGSTMEGRAKLPKMHDKAISFRSPSIQNTLKYNSELVDSLVFSIGQNEYLYERQPAYKWPYNEQVEEFDIWLRREVGGPMNLYKGTAVHHQGKLMYVWFCMKEKDERAYFITYEPVRGVNWGARGMEKEFRRNTRNYFADNRNLVDRIGEEEYEVADIIKLVNDYNADFVKAKD